MEDTKLTAQQAVQGVTLSIDSRHKLILAPPRMAQMVEFPAGAFNLNSALPCLDSDELLIHALCQVALYQEDHSNEALLIVGHTETSGDFDRHAQLSEQRARATLAVIAGDEDSWMRAVDSNSVPQDIQQVLQSLAHTRHWDCDPGPIDGVHGQQTEAAISGYQREVNSAFDMDVTVDGILGTETWKSVLHVYRALVLAQGIDLDRSWTVASVNDGVLGCGESFPLEAPGEDGQRSPVNRRVEAYFAASEDFATLEVPADWRRRLSAEEVGLFHSVLWERKPLAPLGSSGAPPCP